MKIENLSTIKCAIIAVIGVLIIGLPLAFLFNCAEKESNESRTIIENKYDTKATPEPQIVVEDTPVIELRYDYGEEALWLAKLVYNEARGVRSVTEQANVIWTLLNRVDSDIDYFEHTIIGALFQPEQFEISEEDAVDAPVVDDYGRDLIELATKVLECWAYNDNEYKRTLPEDYFYYMGDCNREHNHFIKDFDIFKSLESTERRCEDFAGLEYDYELGYLEEVG